MTNTNSATTRTTAATDVPLRRLGPATWKWLLAIGAVDAVLGVVILLWPGPSTAVVAVIFGASLVLSGLGSVIAGLSATMPMWSRAAFVIFGVLATLFGLICLRDLTQSIQLLGLWIGIGWFITGLNRFLSGIGVTGSGWTVLSGLIMTVAGIVMVTSPFTSVLTLVLVSGILLIVSGIAEILHALQVRRLVSSS